MFSQRGAHTLQDADVLKFWRTKKKNNYLNQRLVERYEAPCGRFIMNYNNIFLHLPIKNMSSYLIKTDVSDDFPPNNKIPDFSEALGFISLQHT